MHDLATCFLALYLAHLLTDFVLQSDRLVAQKRAGSVLAYTRHGAVHLVASLVLLAVALPGLAERPDLYGLIAGLTLVHLGIDWGKAQLVRSNSAWDGAKVFLLDQVLHGITVGITAWLLIRPPLPDLSSSFAGFRPHVEKTLLVLVVYVGIIFGGGYLIRSLTKLLVKEDLGITGQTTNEMQNAGLYIGWLERFLVLTALVLHSPATVGLILTAKSIARYPEFKSVRFAEYFLIGTLLSVSLGIVGGLILLKTLYGTVTLSN
jgi:hypothetical protein